MWHVWHSECTLERMVPRRLPWLLLALIAGTVALVGPSGDATAQAEPCDAWDVDYGLSASLKLTDTPMGAGNGVYTVGPGSVVIRYVNANGKLGSVARMRSYTMKEHFTIDSHVVFWTTHVVTETQTQTTPAMCGDVANGELTGQNLRWLTPLAGYRTDGTLTCEGSLCGNFGAPPPGKSELHIAPHGVPFSAFQFAPDMKTFTMPSTFVAKTDAPKQTAFIALAGREMRRTCVHVTPCP